MKAITEPEAVGRVKAALLHINETEIRLLNSQDRSQKLGHVNQAASYARARAELMPVRAILLGE